MRHAMDSRGLRRMLKRDPFEEFEIEMSSGLACRVWNPECAIVSREYRGVFDREGIPDILNCAHIVRARPVEDP